MEDSWWVAAVQWGLLALIMFAVMNWVARARQPRGPDEENVLVYPVSILYIGLVSAGFFLLFAILIMVSESGSFLLGLLVLACALVGLSPILEHQRVRHVLEPGGLRYQTVLGKTGLLAWADVSRVRYSRSYKWFRLDTSSGQTVRVSAFLLGIPEFAKALLAEVPAHRIDMMARAVLEKSAAGSPPSLWSR